MSEGMNGHRSVDQTILPLHPFVSTLPGGGGGGGPGCMINIFWGPGSCTRGTAWPLGNYAVFLTLFLLSQEMARLRTITSPGRQLVISWFC